MKLPKQGYTAVVWIAANQEPTNHLVRDMSNMKADFEAKGIPMYFMFTDQAQMKKFARHDFKPLPENRNGDKTAENGKRKKSIY